MMASHRRRAFRSDMQQTKSNKWLMRWIPDDEQADVRLFCFPHAGGGAAAYRLWARLLGPSIDLCAIQYPGRANRLNEPPLDRMQVLVENVLAHLRPQLDRPFAFFGHSMGSIVAAEVCRALHRDGEPLPVQLFVSGRRPPGRPDVNAPLRHLSDAAFLAEIERRYGSIPAEIASEPDLLALLLPALRADIAMIETHRPEVRAPLDCPILAMGGSDDPLTPPEHLEDWASETRGEFGMRMFPGGHFYLDACRDAAVAEVRRTLLLRMPQPVANIGR